MQIKILGYSDDTICVDGDVPGCDEYYLTKGVIVLEPSGDRFHFEYTDEGLWKIVHHKGSFTGGLMKVEIKQATDQEENYSDVATIDGYINKVFAFQNYPPTTEELFDRIERKIEVGLSDKEVMIVWNALGRP